MSEQNTPISRRQLMKGAAMGLGGLAAAPAHAFLSELALLKYRLAVPEIFQSVPRPPSHIKHLVIGSGFGGAVTALRLAQAGEPVSVLERGFRWPLGAWRDTFTNDTLPDGRAFWFRNQAKMLAGNTTYFDYFGGVMDVREYDNMRVWCGACVGGGSVIFTGVMIEPERRYFDALFNGAVSYDEMHSIYYPKVRQMLRLDALPADLYNTIPFGHSRVWDEQSRKAGYTTYPIDSIFNWDVVRSELRLQSKASATVGMSNHGNSNGAKYDLDQNYLKQAEATGRAKVYPAHEVLNIGWDGTRYTVDTIKRSPDGRQLDRYVLTCDRLYLAAGSVGSTELLVKARAQSQLRNLNAEVGQGWGNNGNLLVVRSFSALKGLTQATPSASRIHDDKGSVPVTLENWYVPGVPVDVGILGSLGITFTPTRGHFDYDPATDKAQLRWAANAMDTPIAAVRTVNNRIAQASGSVPGAWPFADDVLTGFTAHPLGGAVLNKATDAYGRVKGHDRLYVMDGALMPGSSGAVNPSLTITALAERNIANIIRNGG